MIEKKIEKIYELNNIAFYYIKTSDKILERTNVNTPKILKSSVIIKTTFAWGLDICL